ncbi:glycoprotease [Campylobacterota bacterium]|nr:glycoprotease [Campylobacterota bacterium]
MRSVSLLLLSATRPTRLAIYGEDGGVIEQFQSDLPLTESLYDAIKAFDEAYAIERVLYARGPGSFMGLKLGYLFLRSFALGRGIDFLAADSFALSGGAPIHSHSKRWFVLENGSAAIRSFDSAPAEVLSPPERLDLTLFSAETAPNYILSAV